MVLFDWLEAQAALIGQRQPGRPLWATTALHRPSLTSHASAARPHAI